LDFNKAKFDYSGVGRVFSQLLFLRRKHLAIDIKMNRTFGRRLILLLATGAGAGYLPWCPGTFGTVLAVPLSLELNHIAAWSRLLALLILVILIFCAVSLSKSAADLLRQTDPRVIVIDEIVGFLVANFLAPPGILASALAFAFFRFFDIAKVFPVSRLEKLPGGRGIVLDDVMAGLYAFGIMQVLFWLKIL
jgi:phosphatidylglycerophosphatase A